MKFEERTFYGSPYSDSGRHPNFYWRYPLVYKNGLSPLITYISENTHCISLSAVCLRTKKILNRLRAYIELRGIAVKSIKIRHNREIEAIEVKNAIDFLEQLHFLEVSEGGILPNNINAFTIQSIVEALKKGNNSYLSSKIFYGADSLLLRILSVPLKFIFLPDLGEGEYVLSSESLRRLIGEDEFIKFSSCNFPLKCRIRGFSNQFFLIDAYQSSLVFRYLEEVCRKYSNSVVGLLSCYAVQGMKKALAIQQNNFYSDKEEAQLLGNI